MVIGQFPTASGFGEFRIKAMEHVETEWVIPVDADERISPEHL